MSSSGGVSLLQPYLGRESSDWYRGTADAVFQNIYFLEESRADLAAVGALARTLDVRLSIHPAQYIVLNSTDEEVARKAAGHRVGGLERNKAQRKARGHLRGKGKSLPHTSISPDKTVLLPLLSPYLILLW